MVDDERRRRLALNEAVARDVNAEVEKLAADRHPAGEPFELVCECSRVSCGERVRLTFAEYSAVRGHPDRFLLVDTHVNEQIERRVGTSGTATVVEKFGVGRRVATETA
jgi:hypothetical protein